MLVQYHADLSTSQSSRRFGKSGRPRRRRRRLCARPTTSATVPTFNSVGTRVVPQAKLPSMVRCDRLSVCLDKLLHTHSSRPLGTSLQPLAITPLLNMARKARVFLRAWLSMLPQTATHTTVPIVTTAATRNRPTDRTPKCTSRVISRVLRNALFEPLQHSMLS
jgi:hypothetical protein